MTTDIGDAEDALEWRTGDLGGDLPALRGDLHDQLPRLPMVPEPRLVDRCPLLTLASN